MEKQIFDRYLDIQFELQQKRHEFDKSNKSLKKEIEVLVQKLSNRRNAFNKSINNLCEEKRSIEEKFIKTGTVILNKIDKLIRSKYWDYPKEALPEFVIIQTVFVNKKDHINFDISRCDLSRFEEIDNINVKFYSTERWSDQFITGYISIPIEYFITNCLDDEVYINSIYNKIDFKKTARKNAEKADEIAELEAKLAILKGEI